MRLGLGRRFGEFERLETAVVATPIDDFQEDKETSGRSSTTNAPGHETSLTSTESVSFGIPFIFDVTVTTRQTASRVTRQFADLNGVGAVLARARARHATGPTRCAMALKSNSPPVRSKGTKPTSSSSSYERRSVLVTSNLAFSEWPKVSFSSPPKTTAAALLDRLAHHAVVITTKGKSFRMRKRNETEEEASQKAAKSSKNRAS